MDDVAMATFPFESIRNAVEVAKEAVVVEIKNRGLVSPAIPARESRAAGVVEAMPKLRLEMSVMRYEAISSVVAAE